MIALIAMPFCFLVPLIVTLAVKTWRGFLIVAAIAVVIIGGLSIDMPNPNGIAATVFGPFLGGLMLFGFGAGLIAKFVMLLGRR